jgi:cytochrome c1
MKIEMKKLNRIIKGTVILLVPVLYILIVTISSCASTSPAASQSSGAQLWGENCIRCHSAPTPESFSDAQWDVALSHMRLRASLTEEETRKILEFLKSAN